MTIVNKTSNVPDPSKISRILPKTPEMEQFLSAGYNGMTVEQAKAIIKERGENPAAWPYEVFKQAQAFLAAYAATPVAIDTEPGWHRSQSENMEA